MSHVSTKYETIIGLEVHIQVSTKSKAYCSDEYSFGKSPNTCVSPISLGHPGTLPKPNKKVLESAIKLGLALNCNITPINQYARKNYYYADLPKGYQITQDKTPICTGGFVEILDDNNSFKINLTRIHMEEDAGKSIHDLDPFNSLIDLNRAGVPLLEIVSEPELRSSQEAYDYLYEVRKLVRFLGICNGNMEEGSLRCDANISVRPLGTIELRNRVEVKNLNSFSNVQKAIDSEVERQIQIYEDGGNIDQETRNYNPKNNSTTILRKKEDAQDYRYFPEPDIQPIIIDKKMIDEVRKSITELPNELYKKYTEQYKLSSYDAKNLTENKDLVLFFESILKYTKHYKTATNVMMGMIKAHLNEKSIEISDLNIDPKCIGELVNLIEENIISQLIATQKVFPEMIKDPKQSPKVIAEKNNWIQQKNDNVLNKYVQEALNKYPEKVIEYKNGNKNLLGLFMGEAMKLSKGNANPKTLSELIKKELD
jgi:aspartyl-tRNA(Asn)/glutamyl-tRNA(Gln) amidotransferase subunit B